MLLNNFFCLFKVWSGFGQGIKLQRQAFGQIPRANAWVGKALYEMKHRVNFIVFGFNLRLQDLSDFIIGGCEIASSIKAADECLRNALI